MVESNPSQLTGDSSADPEPSRPSNIAPQIQLDHNESLPDTQERRAGADDTTDTQFLLAEFGTLVDLWKHTDARFESGMGIYLTGSAIMVSALAFFSQSITNIYLFLSIASGMAIGMAIVGIFLARRMVAASIVKSEYIYAMNLIRLYFVEKRPEIRPYLVLPVGELPHTPIHDKRSSMRPLLSYSFIAVIHLGVSLLLGFGIGVIGWLLVVVALRGSVELGLIVAIITGSVTSVGSVVLLTLYLRRRLKAFGIKRAMF